MKPTSLPSRAASELRAPREPRAPLPTEPVPLLSEDGEDTVEPMGQEITKVQVRENMVLGQVVGAQLRPKGSGGCRKCFR